MSRTTMLKGARFSTEKGSHPCPPLVVSGCSRCSGPSNDICDGRVRAPPVGTLAHIDNIRKCCERHRPDKSPRCCVRVEEPS